MTLYDYANTILMGESLEDKLLSSVDIVWDEMETWQPERCDMPGRSSQIAFSEDQIKFPSKEALRVDKEKGKALHFFANHELLAIEMMAQALLLFPELLISQKKLLVSTIEEEQKHFMLYSERMGEFGVNFGDYPLNSFFWSFMSEIHSADQFYSVVALTFEQANLDFAHFYKELFKKLGDIKTYQILEEVYQDEIKHVARGRVELQKKVNSADELWAYYCENLPGKLTPARAKGIHFDNFGRAKAGLNPHFIENIKNYKNTFSVTNRKQWKK